MMYVILDVNGNEYGCFSNLKEAYELAETIEGTTVFEEEED